MIDKKRHAPDFIIFFATFALISIGTIMVFSSSAYTSLVDARIGDQYFFLRAQFRNLLIGFAVLIIAMNVHYKILYKLATPILLIALVLLGITAFMGEVAGGAGRWIGFAGIRFQPSEIAKLAIVIFVAKSLYLNRKYLKDFWIGLMPQLIILGTVFGLVMAQPDLGTAVVIAGTVFLLWAVAGIRMSHLGGIALAGVAVVAALIIQAPYRMNRITAFLNPYEDPLGAGFQAIQSQLALGSGGLFGMGLGQGRQKLFYLPEQHTDFIFAILGEELGFVGATLVLALFVLFAWRGFKIALNAPDYFTSLLAAGITIMISFQALLNIGVVTGALPITGITLPFISYGGTSLIFTMAGVGVLLGISRYTKKSTES